ncbi:hypothetical protein [Thermococcus eurythermalis]|uniref:hypothetical protein n=1 Tax=Thermococcus eurythermalis TaxID=1505907 RepID=UPI000AE42C32|nr:hypothetical protein [Thermococcus eurythermalis]
MGVDHYVYFFFDKMLDEVVNILNKLGRVTFKPVDWEFEEKIRQWLVREWYRYRIRVPEPVRVYSGVLFPNHRIKTVEGKEIGDMDFSIYRVGWLSVLELHPNPRSWWWDAYSHEVIAFLRQFFKWDVLLIAGLNDWTDLREALGLDNMELFVARLAEWTALRSLPVVPSSLTLAKEGLLDIGYGLYRLFLPEKERYGYILVEPFNGYTAAWVAGAVDFRDPEEVCDAFGEGMELALDLTGASLLPLRELEPVHDDELVSLVRKTFRAHVVGNYDLLPCGERWWER